ncbi:MAG: hypothetical protein IKG90_09000 [Bacteroidales bacterium]|nr:hypothetical protein [Bacteroidales bacterium]
MNFSLFNKAIEYSFTWGGPLKVLGEGKVCEGDLDVKYDQGKGRRWTDEYIGVAFDKGITEVEAGFLEGFPNLEYVVIPYTLQSIEVTPELKAMLQQKNVLIRGWYDSYGERFAQENGLAFRHANIIVGWTRDEEHDTSTRLEIRFNEEGKPYRFYDDVCSGWAASNSGGGTYERELDEDFFVGETLESFADWFERFRDAILKNDDLKYYLETANKRYLQKTQ